MNYVGGGILRRKRLDIDMLHGFCVLVVNYIYFLAPRYGKYV